MTSKKQIFASLFLPTLYLSAFFFLFLVYFPNLHEKREFHITTDLFYTGFDSYNNEQYCGSYYYRFTDSKLEFYLLREKKTETITAPLVLYGTRKSNSSELAKVEQKLASITSFSEQEIYDLAQDHTYLEQIVISPQRKLSIGISILFAMFSLYEIVHFFLLLFRPSAKRQ